MQKRFFVMDLYRLHILMTILNQSFKSSKRYFNLTFIWPLPFSSEQILHLQFVNTISLSTQKITYTHTFDTNTRFFPSRAIFAHAIIVAHLLALFSPTFAHAETLSIRGDFFLFRGIIVLFFRVFSFFLVSRDDFFSAVAECRRGKIGRWIMKVGRLSGFLSRGSHSCL